MYNFPSADAATACEHIYIIISLLQNQHPHSSILISGDLNHTSLSSTLPTFTQYVRCIKLTTSPPTWSVRSQLNPGVDILYTQSIYTTQGERSMAPLKKSFQQIDSAPPRMVPVPTTAHSWDSYHYRPVFLNSLPNKVSNTLEHLRPTESSLPYAHPDWLLLRDQGRSC